MKLHEIANISQGIPLNRIRIGENMDTTQKFVYSFEKKSKILVPLDIDGAEQHIPLAKKDMILVNLTSYNAKKAKEEDIGNVIPSNYIILEIKNKQKVDPDYLEWHIDKSQSFARELQRIKQGSTIQSIPINEFRRMNIRLPDMEFQRKLGRINKLNKRRDTLHKERKELIGKLLIEIDKEEY